MTKSEIDRSTIFLTITGSQAYGVSTPDSDTDIRGIAIMPKEYFLGIKNFEQYEDPSNDLVIYDIRKAFKLIADANPNMLELLFAPTRCVQRTSMVWEHVLKHRNLFISSKVRWTYSGYAMSQIKRAETHRRWLRNPPLRKPERQDFHLEEMSLFPSTQIDAITSIDDNFILPIFKAIAIQERQFRTAINEWNNYEEWRSKRNRKRFEIESKFGYDCKHLSHTVRLLRQGIEILEKGEVLVDRTGIDADELIAIKNGAWSWDRIIGYSKEMESRLDEAYTKTTLPRSADYEKINDLCCEIVERKLNGNMYILQ